MFVLWFSATYRKWWISLPTFSFFQLYRKLHCDYYKYRNRMYVHIAKYKDLYKLKINIIYFPNLYKDTVVYSNYFKYYFNYIWKERFFIPLWNIISFMLNTEIWCEISHLILAKWKWTLAIKTKALVLFLSFLRCT